MAPGALELRCVPFSKRNFCEEVRRASTSPEESSLPAQARYIASFLEHDDCGARTILVETPYVDRHYLEEYVGYYSTLLTPPPSQTVRLHVFAQELSTTGVQDLIRRAAAGEYDAVQSELNRAYLGFVIVRPLAVAPIGRTILRPYGGSGDRCYGRTQLHTVHLAGLTLTVEGVPFQQQDQAVGACATTAVWSALARVVRADGARAPTPLAVTMAATKNIHEGRVLPAEGGLEVNQICAAIREFGYSPLILKPDQEAAIFQMALKCYVRSGIPVVLHLSVAGDGHAATVVGFRGHHPAEPPPPLELKINERHSLRSSGMSRVYVHDDRLGPYARMRWLPPDEHGWPRLEFFPYESGYEEHTKPIGIWKAIVPLYPKLRLTATDLISLAGDLLPLFKMVSRNRPEISEDMNVELRFAQGGSYQEELLRSQRIAPERARAFVQGVHLSRYVGIIEFQANGEWLADVLCDSTDIRRPSSSRASLLAVVPKFEDQIDGLQRGLSGGMRPVHVS